MNNGLRESYKKSLQPTAGYIISLALSSLWLVCPAPRWRYAIGCLRKFFESMLHCWQRSLSWIHVGWGRSVSPSPCQNNRPIGRKSAGSHTCQQSNALLALFGLTSTSNFFFSFIFVLFFNEKASQRREIRRGRWRWSNQQLLLHLSPLL